MKLGKGRADFRVFLDELEQEDGVKTVNIERSRDPLHGDFEFTVTYFNGDIIKGYCDDWHSLEDESECQFYFKGVEER